MAAGATVACGLQAGATMSWASIICSLQSCCFYSMQSTELGFYNMQSLQSWSFYNMQSAELELLQYAVYRLELLAGASIIYGLQSWSYYSYAVYRAGASIVYVYRLGFCICSLQSWSFYNMQSTELGFYNMQSTELGFYSMQVPQSWSFYNMQSTELGFYNMQSAGWSFYNMQSYRAGASIICSLQSWASAELELCNMQSTGWSFYSMQATEARASIICSLQSWVSILCSLQSWASIICSLQSWSFYNMQSTEAGASIICSLQSWASILYCLQSWSFYNMQSLQAGLLLEYCSMWSTTELGYCSMWSEAGATIVCGPQSWSYNGMQVCRTGFPIICSLQIYNRAGASIICSLQGWTSIMQSTEWSFYNMQSTGWSYYSMYVVCKAGAIVCDLQAGLLYYSMQSTELRSCTGSVWSGLELLWRGPRARLCLQDIYTTASMNLPGLGCVMLWMAQCAVVNLAHTEPHATVAPAL
ncbi:hypothetical protein Hamer_G015173 [Homarus americanus]|uniref:Uncharacterized protein n=1 Tax=Homarus americanus TaxID=6706 RepID=A0A8J5N8W5_HOMAM|nr:hypothetical protein Hamer_G015173 [Homarus americanus]